MINQVIDILCYTTMGIMGMIVMFGLIMETRDMVRWFKDNY